MSESSQAVTGDGELAQRIRAGDERALEEVFRAHYAGLTSFAIRFVRSRELAEELVQDLFLSIWSKREDMPSVESFRTYLFRAIRNRALNHLRREKLERRWTEQAVDESEGAAPTHSDEVAIEGEVSGAIRAAIDKLPARCREVFLLSRDGGLTYIEIAESLGISVKTVETQMGRALKSLRISLERHR